MSQEQINALIARLASDSNFASTLAAASSEEEALRIAGEHGFDVTLLELATATAEGELSDEELELVAGGRTQTIGYGC